ncbi:MAG: amidohydrolase family protein [Thermoanaerobaculia bacterium]
MAVSLRLAATLLVASGLGTPLAAAEAPDVHALRNVRIVVAPGRVIPNGTVVVRDGILEAVGPTVTPPPDARIWDLAGKTVYPGLIDPYVPRSWPAETDANRPRDADPNPLVRPERDLAAWAGDDAANAKLREAGFTTALLAPKDGIFRGASALVDLGDGGTRANLLSRAFAQHVRVAPPAGNQAYPDSLMGAVALFRQTLLDARWQADAQGHFRANSAQRRPPDSTALAALAGAVRGHDLVIFETADLLDELRARKLIDEFALRAWVVGNGEEYRRLDLLRQDPLPILLPLAFPAAPKVGESDDLATPIEALRHWDAAPDNPKKLVDAKLPVAFTTFGHDDARKFYPDLAKAIARGLTVDQALAALTTVPAELLGLSGRAGTLEAGKMANFVVVDGDLLVEKPKIRAVWVDGRPYELEEEKKDDQAPAEKGGEEKLAAAAPATAPATPAASGPGVEKPPALPDPEAWRNPAPEQPAAILVRNATIWTSGPQGVLENADLLVRKGKIAAVGKGLDAPRGALVIDAAGKQVTAGLIDCHSHTAVAGDVNEGTHNVTAEVRVADVIDSESPDIYRQLAGGVTTIHQLHGSANAIGGQDSIVKLRWGAPPDELPFDGAPPGIKFALGENPKQSNWGEREKRFPQTRMGVEQLIRERFLAALDYQREWKEWEGAKAKNRVPPRRDLQLEAIGEILAGKRRIHSHSYRADEILMLLRLAEQFGVRVATFQHGLESYKVADEIARHGAGVSMFSDWWAYKYEVIDAIPWAGAIDWQRGVVVSYNSDSDELARRLNLEAAKAMRYGDVPAAEALKFVTLNPALQLGIADRVGSLEVGKDADFVIWSGSPLSTLALAEQTWVDGRKYFDRAADLAARPALAAERAALVTKARAAQTPTEDGDRPKEER